MFKKILFSLFLLLIPISVSAQSLTPACSRPPPSFGVVWTPTQWIQCLSSFQAYLGYIPLNSAGGTMTGELTLQQSVTTNAPITMPQGLAPTSPVNGDLWQTSLGLFYRSGGSTIGPLIGSGGGSGIVVGTTVVSSGTTGRVLYDNGGLLGEYGITGTGNVVLSIHPTIEGVTSTGATGTGNFVFSAAPTLTGHPTIEGVTSTGATGTGNFVFSAAPTFSGTVTTAASATGGSGLNLPAGAAPTSPVNGDIWTTTSGLFARISGVTIGPYLSSASLPPAVVWSDTPLTSNTAVSANSGSCVNTSGGVVTITLPTAPTAGTLIELDDCNQTFGTNALTVARGGSDKIMGLSANLLNNRANWSLLLRYNAAQTNWLIIP